MTTKTRMPGAPLMRSIYHTIVPYVTMDGSEIRELMHPAVHGNRNQSFAEATVQPGTQTALHRHNITEEIYHITEGQGMMRLGDETFPVAAGGNGRMPPGDP